MRFTNKDIMHSAINMEKGIYCEVPTVIRGVKGEKSACHSEALAKWEPFITLRAKHVRGMPQRDPFGGILKEVY
jgi:hypothetical protein